MEKKRGMHEARQTAEFGGLTVLLLQPEFPENELAGQVGVLQPSEKGTKKLCT